MSDRHGVEIDYCPKCRGVWLDRGELDKIIERGTEASPAAAPQRREADAPPFYHPEPRRDAPAAYREAQPRRDESDDDRKDRRPKRRDCFLSDLFDF